MRTGLHDHVRVHYAPIHDSTRVDDDPVQQDAVPHLGTGVDDDAGLQHRPHRSAEDVAAGGQQTA